MAGASEIMRPSAVDEDERVDTVVHTVSDTSSWWDTTERVWWHGAAVAILSRGPLPR